MLVGSMTSTFHTGGALGTLAFASSSAPVLLAPRCVKSGSLKLSRDTRERICAPRSRPSASLELASTPADPFPALAPPPDAMMRVGLMGSTRATGCATCAKGIWSATGYRLVRGACGTSKIWVSYAVPLSSAMSSTQSLTPQQWDERLRELTQVVEIGPLLFESCSDVRLISDTDVVQARRGARRLWRSSHCPGDGCRESHRSQRVSTARTCPHSHFRKCMCVTLR